MTDSTPKYNSPIDKSILGALGEGNTVNQFIQSQPAPPAPYLLPQDIGDFTGRQDYIAQLEATLDWGKIATIAGIPGVGKSALAIRVAYRLQDRYPDAQLYVNLYGQDPQLALDTKTVLIRFLRALTGRDESQLPTDLEGLKGQYRSILATKQAIIILDNARDEAQIRDLLPSNPKCAVVVTSRSRLTGLPGAVQIDLAPMAVGVGRELDEAELLFQAILQDGKRVDAELPEAREIVNLCGGLPIAIRISAATLDRQIWARKSLQDYAKELATESTRLNKLENENVEAAIPGQGSVRASFNLSYQGLTEEDRQLFRWAGGLPGVNFGLKILATVMEWEESQIEAGLGRLLEAQVLELRGEERFGWHDLMRLFAKEQLTELERETIVDRGLTWYCERADYWHKGLDPVRCRQLAQQLVAETEDDAQEWEQRLPMMALNWFAAEQNNWVDVVRDLTQIPRPDDAVALAANLAPFFDLRGIWGDWVTTHELVKNSSKQARNLTGICTTLNNLGLAYGRQGEWEKAIDCYQESLEICYQLGDLYRTAPSLMNLGIMYKNQGKWKEAIDCYQKSLEICHQIRDPQGTANVLMALGTVYTSQSRWEQAIDCYQESIEIKDWLGDNHGKAQILNNIGLVYRNQGKWEEAISLHQESLKIFRKIGDRQGEAQALSNLGNVYSNQGKWEKAISFYEQDLLISSQLRDCYGEAQTLGNLGLVYDNLGKWEEAIDLYERSLKIKLQLGDRHGEAQTLGNLGNVFNKQGKSDDAISLYEKSLEIKCLLGDYHGEAQTIGNLGVVYHNQGKLVNAISCFQQSSEIFCQLGDFHWAGLNLMNLGLVYKLQNQTTQARSLWRKALTYLQPSSPQFQTVQQWLENFT